MIVIGIVEFDSNLTTFSAKQVQIVVFIYLFIVGHQSWIANALIVGAKALTGKRIGGL